MINDIENKSRKELVEIVKIQQEEFKKLLNEKVALEKERNHLKALSLLITPDAIDLIRCGIGGNYGGERFIEKMNETHTPILAAFNHVDGLLQAHNLEQRAKGVADLMVKETSVGRLRNDSKRSFIFCSDASRYMHDLLNQAKALEDGE